MSAEVELALRKQRLLIRSAELRGELAAHVAGVAPLFAAGDHVRSAALWLRDHGKVLIAVMAALAAARPRAVLRWGRRGAMVWQGWRRLRGWLQDRLQRAP